MNISWTDLRPLNGSQHAAFEELVCQLAAGETVPEGARFIRIGAPDAGVEAVWILPNGDEWGWQAKFFMSTPGNSQWKQMDESVQTALIKRPRLTRLTICIPLDRQDPRIPDQHWFMDRWNQRVTQWTAAAGTRAVDFRYWGQFEILERLAREENRGRTYFWFNAEVLTGDWFRGRLDEAIANAGARYTPELNVELPIVHTFDGLGCRPEFFRELKSLLREIRKSHARAPSPTVRQIAPAAFDVLDADIARLREVIDAIPEPAGWVDWETIRETCTAAVEHASACEALIAAEKSAPRERAAAQPTDSRQAATASDGTLISQEESNLFQLSRRLRDLESWSQTAAAEAVNLSTLLVTGEAGSGKTHLFCDVAERRLAAGAPTVLALGQHFTTGEPWTQLIGLLGLTCARDVFLGAMNAAGQAVGSRALILLDALNESSGKTFWSGHLPAMITAVSRFPWVGLAVSVRNSYEELIIPSELVPHRLPRVEHTGFADHELKAADAFFDHFGVERPSVPLLRPEFQNPLFLKLFCKGLNDAGLREVPKGLEGISTIFSYFLESVNGKLARPDELNFNRKRDLVGSATRRFAEELALRGADELPEEVAEDLVNELLPGRPFEDSLYRRLITEGVLAEDRHAVYEPGSRQFTHTDVVRFEYERLGDFLKAEYLVDAHLDTSNPQPSFAADTPLGQLVADDVACHRNRGLIDALSVLLPERIGMELGEVAPHCADFVPVRQAFVASILWRKPQAVLDSTLEHARQHALRFHGSSESFTDVLLAVAASPDHPFNASFLHQVLRSQSLPERDAWWSIYLHDRFSYHEASPVQRLVDWAWHAPGKSAISDEAMHLAAVGLCWFFASSNRTLRDRATKAAVSMLTPRLFVVARLVDDFADVDDPYVTERVYAVAYGCAMRSTDDAPLGRLAQAVYDRVFKEGNPPVNILTRDYARGVIEMAHHRGLRIDGSLDLVRPPYGSGWPETIPSEEEVTSLEAVADAKSNGAWDIFHSLGRHGDFARYIIGTNSGTFEWLPRRLGAERRPSAREVHDQFVAGLTKTQRAAFDEWQALRQLALLEEELLHHLREDGFSHSKADLEALAAAALAKFRKSIHGRKRDTFDSAVRMYIESPQTRGERFDLSQLCRWILTRVFELGWTAERFGTFDRRVGSSDPSRAGHVERIGKKYQWIALYEVLARVADNFEFRVSRSDDEAIGTYVSPAQISRLRNIDPSATEAATRAQPWWETVERVWWAPFSVDEWHEELSDPEWLRSSDSIPQPIDFLRVMAPDGASWLALNGQYTWREPEKEDDLGDDGLKGREVKLWISSYLVPEVQVGAWLEWARRPAVTDEHPEGPVELHHVFAGEIPWAPAFEALYPDADAAVDAYGFNQRYPSGAYHTTQEFSWESGYDGSMEESVTLDLPSAFLMREMPLQWNGQGRYSSGGWSISAMDPSVIEPGPSVLLLHQNTVSDFLGRKKLSVVWIVSGEKNAYGQGLTRRDRDNEWHGRTYIRGAYSWTPGSPIAGGYEVEFRPNG